MGKQETEAYELVCKLNEELYARFGDKQIDEVPGFSFTGNEYTFAILWGDICVWDSENCSMYDEEDNEIPIEQFVRIEIARIAPAIEWITRNLARQVVSFDHCLWFLNELVKVDAAALAALIEQRVPCNEAMVDHPTVQVQVREEMDGIPGEVGFLGIFNGLFGAYRDGGPKDGWGQIAAVFEEDGRLSGFRRTKDPEVKPVEPDEGGSS